MLYKLFERKNAEALRKIRWFSCLKRRTRMPIIKVVSVVPCRTSCLKKRTRMPSEKSDDSVVWKEERGCPIIKVVSVVQCRTCCLKERARMPSEKSDDSVVSQTRKVAGTSLLDFPTTLYRFCLSSVSGYGYTLITVWESCWHRFPWKSLSILLHLIHRYSDSLQTNSWPECVCPSICQLSVSAW